MKKINIALFILAAILAMANLMQGQTMKTDTSFFKNGTVMELNTYSNHVRVERAVYYPTGEIQLYQEFDPVTGLQIGDEYWYHRNGELEHSCDWVNGYAHGWAFTWDEGGELISSQVYVENRLVPTEDYEKYFPDREVDSESASVSGFAIRR
jgi:antitoxin component YwqK of YwqJK toxin-antitoxin module